MDVLAAAHFTFVKKNAPIFVNQLNFVIIKIINTFLIRREHDEIRSCFISIKKLQDIANSYRKRYDTNYALIPPHLTLRTPFELTDLEAAEVVSTLRVRKNASPITLRIKNSVHSLL